MATSIDYGSTTLIKLAKRRGDNYSDMNIIRFRHCTSGLKTRVSKLDIMTSQKHRFRFIYLFALHRFLQRDGKLVVRHEHKVIPPSPTQWNAPVYTTRVARIV